MMDVRKLDLEVDIDTYPAIERTLIEGIRDGDAPPTVMNWTFGDLFLVLGPVEDASLIDRDRAETEGIDYGRRYNVSGGTGFFEGDNSPVLYMFFPDRDEHTMTEYIDMAGEAMAEALSDAGVEDAVYREGGDIELEPDEPGGQYAKIGVSGAGYQDGVWGVFTNLINWTFSPDRFGLIDEILRLPEEKFEDKETDSAAGRMTSLADVAPEVNVDDVLAAASTNLTSELVGGEAVAGELTQDEREAIDEHAEYFGSDEWFERYDTRHVFDQAGPDDRVAEIAYKGRKLIKVSAVVAPDDTIEHVQITGDVYHKPGFEAIERLNDALTGLSIEDDDALLAALEDVYAQDEVEMPWLPAEDYLAPLVRARENLMPVDEFERN